MLKPMASVMAAMIMMAFPALAQKADDSDQIKAAVMDYFEGQGEASRERLDRAFETNVADMLTIAKNDNGEDYIREWDMADVVVRWSEGEPVTEPRVGRIMNMQIIDGRLASVTFDSNGMFYDLLTLAKVNGQWKIINKAFIRQ